jgi:serine/threonine protein kinase
MAIAIGQKLGSYEILSLLGKGGMGEVYRARDSKLKREVAIKVLPETFAGDLERVSRFQREAEVLASLNHPHIAAIHDLQEFGESRYLILSFLRMANGSPTSPMNQADSKFISSLFLAREQEFPSRQMAEQKHVGAGMVRNCSTWPSTAASSLFLFACPPAQAK